MYEEILVAIDKINIRFHRVNNSLVDSWQAYSKLITKLIAIVTNHDSIIVINNMMHCNCISVITNYHHYYILFPCVWFSQNCYHFKIHRHPSRLFCCIAINSISFPALFRMSLCASIIFLLFLISCLLLLLLCFCFLLFLFSFFFFLFYDDIHA